MAALYPKEKPLIERRSDILEKVWQQWAVEDEARFGRKTAFAKFNHISRKQKKVRRFEQWLYQNFRGEVTQVNKMRYVEFKYEEDRTAFLLMGL